MKLLYILIFLLQVWNASSNEDSYSFVPRVKENGKVRVKENGISKLVDVRRVFITLVVNGYSFRRKDNIRSRVPGESKVIRFLCKNCESMGRLLYIRSIVQIGISEEDDKYELLNDSDLPSTNDHNCILDGVEAEISSFEVECINSVRKAPQRPICRMYKELRYLELLLYF